MPLDTSRSVLQSVGNYRTTRKKLPKAGMGAIYRSRRRDTGDIVAVKIMPSHMASNPILVAASSRSSTRPVVSIIPISSAPSISARPAAFPISTWSSWRASRWDKTSAPRGADELKTKRFA